MDFMTTVFSARRDIQGLDTKGVKKSGHLSGKQTRKREFIASA
jgi:hypothetical protein